MQTPRSRKPLVPLIAGKRLLQHTQKKPQKTLQVVLKNEENEINHE